MKLWAAELRSGERPSRVRLSCQQAAHGSQCVRFAMGGCMSYCLDLDTEPSANALAGQYAIEIISRLCPPDNAKLFHDEVEHSLREARFYVRREANVGIRSSGRGPGRIDLLAEMHGGFVAIELDNKSPRSGSLDKLRAFNAFRLVVLRGAPPWPDERDIDAIISIPVRPL